MVIKLFSSMLFFTFFSFKSNKFVINYDLSLILSYKQGIEPVKKPNVY